MKLDVLIGSTSECKLKVKDLTKPSEYTEGLFGRPFDKTDSKAVDVLTYHKVSGDVTLAPIISDNSEDSIFLDIPEDGWVTLSHIVLPSKEWVENNKEGLQYSGEYYIYCTDGTIIYRYINSEFQETSADVLVLQDNTTNTTMSRIDKDYVTICFLKKCYVNLCKQVFNNLCGLNTSKGKGCFSNQIDKELQTNRDLVWMGINVVKYMTQFTMLPEAQRIIELLESCNGICSGNTSAVKSSSGCGCSKK